MCHQARSLVARDARNLVPGDPMWRLAGRVGLLLLAAAGSPRPSSSDLASPVEGPVLQRFGSAGDGGPANGITYGVPGGSLVFSPCRGRIKFAAPFRTYGRLIILRCDGGADVVLAGLGSLTTAANHIVQPGEVVGRMGTRSSQSRLYLELRRHGHPIDPAPFIGNHPS